MQTKTIFLSALAACSSVASAGYAEVANKCQFPVYLWSATPAGTGAQQTLAAGTGFYQEAYQSGDGVTLKLSRTPGDANLYNGTSLTQYQYTLAGDLTWFSLANTNGDPFKGNKVALLPSGGGQGITWDAGSGPSQILNTASANNLTLTICA